MQLSFSEKASARKPADIVILPFWQDKKGPKAAFPVKEFSSLIGVVLQEKDFLAKSEETLLLYRTKAKEKRVLLLGLGLEQECTEETLRRSYAAAIKACRKKKFKRVNLYIPEGSKLEKDSIVASVTEGVLLVNYAFDQLKRESIQIEPTFLVETFNFVGISKERFALCKKTAQIIESVNFTRDLVNGNADDVTAQALASHARALAKAYSSIHVTVLGKKELEKAKLGLLLAVNRGASHDPALIILHYKGDPHSKDITAIVGKGITFDTGGLNIKPTGSMETMKCDMSGSASVLGTIRAAANVKLKRNIIGVIASAENAIGPNSFKPGDVYVGHAGKSIEIGNTDAEGRLVLADALSYLQKEFSPSRIIDLATLTGAIVVALGEEATGLFSNDDALAKKLIAAGDKTFERVWRMPLYPEYKEHLKSHIADLKNVGSRKGGSCVAAMFLKQFIQKDMPWAHLDIAGSAWHPEAKNYHPTSATGVGVRLLIEFLENL